MKALKLTLGLALAAFVAGKAQAVQINGQINIGPAFGGTVTLDTVANTVVFNGGSEVTAAFGDYAGIGEANVTYQNFTYLPLSVTNPLWSITAADSTAAGGNGKAASFSITSMNIVDETANSIVLFGLGTASLDGFDDTAGSWTFSTDSTGTSNFNWSSTTNAPPAVPDSGATLALLGVGLIGLAGAARRFKR